MKELTNGFFGGNKSFMTNGYVIWRNGLDGDPPNPYGVYQGDTYIQRMLYDRSLDVRSSFYKLLVYLQAIQKKLATTERNFINTYLSKSRDELSSSQASAVNAAIAQDNFGFAYTLLLKSQQEYEELVQEFRGGKFRNISHTNSFWKSQFLTYFSERLSQALEVHGEELLGKLDASLTIDQVVEDWVFEQISGSDGVAIGSLNHMKEQMKEEMLKYFQSKGLNGVQSRFDNILASNNLTSLTKNKTVRTTKTKRKRKLETITKEIGDLMVKSVGLGMSTELEAVARQGKKGFSIQTGQLLKNFVQELSGREQDVQMKSDVISFVAGEHSIDIKKIALEVLGPDLEVTEKGLEQLIAEIEKQAQEFDDVFMVSTNVKGYRSKFDLQIAQQASFAQRAADLEKLSQEANGLPALSAEKLVFLFNNTMRGCLAEHQTYLISEYVAAVCAAWMWDDYTDIMSLKESSSPLQKVRMFDSGGIYYSASQLIGKSIEQLKQEVDDGARFNFVTVDFVSPNFNEHGYYRELKGQYPVPNRGASKEEWQSVLQKRWDLMRDKVVAGGKIGVKIKQAELEKILGDLSQFL